MNARLWTWQDVTYGEAPWITEGPIRGAKIIEKLPPREGKTKKRYTVNIQHGTCHCKGCKCKTTEGVGDDCCGPECHCCSELCT